jgi:hypothetical protein
MRIMTMKSGEFTLKEQSGPKGYFGKVRLDLKPRDGSGTVVTFDESCETSWRVAVQFGITYGWELFSWGKAAPQGLEIAVREIKGQMVDTNSIVVAFVAAHALWNGLEWTPPRPPVLDPKRACFTFSKY